MKIKYGDVKYTIIQVIANANTYMYVVHFFLKFNNLMRIIKQVQKKKKKKIRFETMKILMHVYFFVIDFFNVYACRANIIIR
jgi:hypothetical protein